MANSSDDRAPVPAGKGTPAGSSSRAEIDAFLESVRTIERAPSTRGRLIFALDATMSRQPTWEAACKLQREMFLEAQAIGGLDVQLVFFRGPGFAVGLGARGPCRIDGEDRLPRRCDPNLQSAGPRLP
jgi:hypothetical protein